MTDRDEDLRRYEELELWVADEDREPWPAIAEERSAVVVGLVAAGIVGFLVGFLVGIVAGR